LQGDQSRYWHVPFRALDHNDALSESTKKKRGVSAPHLRLRSYWRKVDGLARKKTLRGSKSNQSHIGVLKELFGQ